MDNFNFDQIQKAFETKKEEIKTREEIEIKFVIPKNILPSRENWKDHYKAQEFHIEQYYLSLESFEKVFKSYPELEEPSVNEIRIRKKNEKYIITSKGSKSKAKYIRFESEKIIDENEYNSLKAKAFCGISKNRYSFETMLAGTEVHIDMDDYIETGNGKLSLDFVTCEVEVPADKYARILISGKFFIPDLIFLRRGINTVYEKGFSNREISENGFPANIYKEIVKYVRDSRLKKIEELSKKATTSKEASKIFEEIDKLLSSIELIDNPPTEEQLNPEGIGIAQNILEDFKFTREQSLGSEIETPRLNQLDSLGKGWLQDFHTIVTSIPFRRLFLKPQVFRVNEGSVDTTTRGTHAVDVISVSQQLCNHLGLNVDFASAMAALHDMGHSPLGHVGEETLHELSGKKFQHHIFSLSLTEIFEMNLLKEILLGAALHKTGGGPLQSQGQPKEITVLRIADKISYVSRDIFDGIRNGYLKETDFPEWVFDTLGNTSESWFEKFIDAAVRESSLEHDVNFSEASGEIYKAYKKSRDVIYKKLHQKIHWAQAKLNLVSCYRYNEKVFSDLDPVVITAYMTDEEVNRLANFIESSPVDRVFDEEELLLRGFGFLDIVNAMRKENFDKSRIYYDYFPKKLIMKRGAN
jgi:dGTP triphosphohydrolase